MARPDWKAALEALSKYRNADNKDNGNSTVVITIIAVGVAIFIAYYLLQGNSTATTGTNNLPISGNTPAPAVVPPVPQR